MITTALKLYWPYFIVLIPIVTAWIYDRQLPPDLGSTIANVISGLLTLCLVVIIQGQRRTLEGISITDKLTGVFNSRYLRIQLDRQVFLSHRTRFPLSMIFLDVDNLKSINDRYGHMVGNAALRRLGQCIDDKIRRHMDLCFRFGGDEFLVLCPHADLETANEIAERILDAPAGIGSLSDKKVTLSLGVVQLREAESPHQFLKRADRAMYSIKQGGKNGIAFDPKPRSAREKVFL